MIFPVLFRNTILIGLAPIVFLPDLSFSFV
jgi:hypothetical protein